jgi:hypothetical protein
VPHWFQVAADAPLRCLQLTSPARFERYAADVGQPAPERLLPPPGRGAPDPARVAAAGERFGIRLLGPPPTLPAP